jgi:hypothetical protein
VARRRPANVLYLWLSSISVRLCRAPCGLKIVNSRLSASMHSACSLTLLGNTHHIRLTIYEDSPCTYSSTMRAWVRARTAVLEYNHTCTGQACTDGAGKLNLVRLYSIAVRSGILVPGYEISYIEYNRRPVAQSHHTVSSYPYAIHNLGELCTHRGAAHAAWAAKEGYLRRRITVTLSIYNFSTWFLAQIVENREGRLSRPFLGHGDNFAKSYYENQIQSESEPAVVRTPTHCQDLITIAPTQCHQNLGFVKQLKFRWALLHDESRILIFETIVLDVLLTLCRVT